MDEQQILDMRKACWKFYENKDGGFVWKYGEEGYNETLILEAAASTYLGCGKYEIGGVVYGYNDWIEVAQKADSYTSSPSEAMWFEREGQDWQEALEKLVSNYKGAPPKYHEDVHEALLLSQLFAKYFKTSMIINVTEYSYICESLYGKYDNHNLCLAILECAYDAILKEQLNDIPRNDDY